MRYNESVEAIEYIVYEMCKIDRQAVHDSIDVYQNEHELLTLLKPLTVWKIY